MTIPLSQKEVGIMATMKQETVVDISDLRYVRVSCQHCKTRVILDLKEKSAPTEKTGILLSDTCPCCCEAYDSSLKGALTTIQKAYDALSSEYVKHKVVFIGECKE